MRQALSVDRLEHIVDRAGVEGRQRMVALRRDEDDVGARADALRDLDAGQAGHAHIEKADLRLALEKSVPGIDAVGRFGHHQQLRPDTPQGGQQLGARRFLVVGDQGGGGHRKAAAAAAKELA